MRARFCCNAKQRQTGKFYLVCLPSVVGEQWKEREKERKCEKRDDVVCLCSWLLALRAEWVRTIKHVVHINFFSFFFRSLFFLSLSRFMFLRLSSVRSLYLGLCSLPPVGVA